MDSWVVPLISGVFALLGGIIGALFAQWLQAHFRRRQFLEEGLLARYADFVAVASAEHDRAFQVESTAALWGDHSDLGAIRGMEEQRHEHRRSLQRLAWQIQLLEHEANLCTLTTQLLANLPFQASLLPAQWGQGNYDERFNQFQQQRIAFGNMIAKLVNAVQSVHVKGRAVVPATAPEVPELPRRTN